MKHFNDEEYDSMKDFFVYFYKYNGNKVFIVNRSLYKTDIVCEFDDNTNEINWEED